MKNAFAKSLFAISYLLVFCVLAQAQNLCENLSTPSPIFLNLQLGMTPEEVQNAFGKTLKIKIKKTGERIFFQNYIKKPAPAPLKNLRALYLRFFEGRLYQVEIFYEKNPAMPTLESITQTLAAQYGFAYENLEIKNKYAKLNCGNIAINADNILNPHLELTDSTTFQKVEEFRKSQKK